VVAAHGVDSDPGSNEVAGRQPGGIHLLGVTPCSVAEARSGRGFGRLALADANRLATTVPAAVRAGMVALFGLVAVWTLLQLRRREREVRSPVALTGM
jgi:hypothetical protein